MKSLNGFQNVSTVIDGSVLGKLFENFATCRSHTSFAAVNLSVEFKIRGV